MIPREMDSSYESLFISFDHPFQSCQFLTLIQIDQNHTLGSAAHLANFIDAGADQNASGRDKHDFVILSYQPCRNHLAVTLAGLDCGHALAAAAVPRVFADGSAFAIAG